MLYLNTARVAAAVGVLAWITGSGWHAQRPWAAPVLGAAVVLPMLLQRRFPLSCLVLAMAALMSKDTIVGRSADNAYLVLLLWSSYGVGRWAERRRLWVAGALALVLSTSAYFADDRPELPADLVFPFFFIAVPCLLGLGRQIADRQIQQLAAQRDELERSRAIAIEAAAQAERLRIARDLHDVVAHSISAVSLQAQVLRRRLQAREQLTPGDVSPVEMTAQEAMTELRAMLGVLRTAAPAGLEPAASFAELPTLLAQARDAGQDVRLTESGTPRHLPPGLSLTAYRVTQEALTNARKHGSAGPTHLTVSWHSDRVLIEARNPCTGAAPSEGHGLTGMRERVTAYGGTVAAGAQGDDWLLVVSLPLAPALAAAMR